MKAITRRITGSESVWTRKQLGHVADRRGFGAPLLSGFESCPDSWVVGCREEWPRTWRALYVYKSRGPGVMVVCPTSMR
jgi:hypothetical protein